MQQQHTHIVIEHTHPYLENVFGNEHEGPQAAPHIDREAQDAYPFENLGALVARRSGKVPSTFRFLTLRQRRHS